MRTRRDELLTALAMAQDLAVRSPRDRDLAAAVELLVADRLRWLAQATMEDESVIAGRCLDCGGLIEAGGTHAFTGKRSCS